MSDNEEKPVNAVGGFIGAFCGLRKVVPSVCAGGALTVALVTLACLSIFALHGSDPRGAALMHPGARDLLQVTEPIGATLTPVPMETQPHTSTSTIVESKAAVEDDDEGDATVDTDDEGDDDGDDDNKMIVKKDLYDLYLVTDEDTGATYHIAPGCSDTAKECTYDTRRFFMNALLMVVLAGMCGCDRCYLGFGGCCCFCKAITLGGLFFWQLYDVATMFGAFGPWTDASGCCPIYGFGMSLAQ